MCTMTTLTRMTAAEYIDIDEHNVFAPDISWIPRLRSARERLPGPPELWLVDTVAESVIVLRRSKPGAPDFDVALELRGDEQLTSPQLPCFALGIADIFRDIP
jgi:hypothetical protein